MDETNFITSSDLMYLAIVPTWTSNSFEVDNVCCEDIGYS